MKIQQMCETSQFNSVSDYYNGQPKKTIKELLELKNYILKVAPNATESLNYNIPAYKLIEGSKREQQIMIASYKNAVGFYPHPTTMVKFDAELNDYKKGKGSVQFPLDKSLPKDFIIRMVKYRLELMNK